MEIVYSDNNSEINIDGKETIFLAGPSPRNNTDYNWRKKAIRIFDQSGFDGIIFIPLPKGEFKHSYLEQIEWEQKYIKSCDKLLFWIPRDLVKLPGFTTNIEFGQFIESDKIYYGRPDDAPKNRYLDTIFKMNQGNKEIHNNLELLIKQVINI